MFWYTLGILRLATGVRWPYKVYLAYLRSKAWRAKRLQVIRRAKGRCENCGALLGNRLEVHHKSYAHLGCERLDELGALCKYCHKKEHGYETAKHTKR